MTVVEIVTFRLAGGTDEAAFLEADERVQNEFIPNLPGFMRRTTARGTDGDWLVIVLWDSSQDADSASKLAENDPVAATFNELIDASTIRTSRFTTLD